MRAFSKSEETRERSSPGIKNRKPLLNNTKEKQAEMKKEANEEKKERIEKEEAKEDTIEEEKIKQKEQEDNEACCQGFSDVNRDQGQTENGGKKSTLIAVTLAVEETLHEFGYDVPSLSNETEEEREPKKDKNQEEKREVSALPTKDQNSLDGETGRSLAMPLSQKEDGEIESKETVSQRGKRATFEFHQDVRAMLGNPTI